MSQKMSKFTRLQVSFSQVDNLWSILENRQTGQLVEKPILTRMPPMYLTLPSSYQLALIAHSRTFNGLWFCKYILGFSLIIFVLPILKLSLRILLCLVT